ncbi:MAG: CPBP family glutamic-type intramembrane protease, partial [Acidimicrobiales bacterium]
MSPPLAGEDGRRPDWYADPCGRHALRYWDGQGWTERVSDAGRPGVDPVDLDLAGWLESRGGDRRSPWPRHVAASAVGVGVTAVVLGAVMAPVAEGHGAGPVASLSLVAAILYGILLAYCSVVGRYYGSERGLRFDFGLTFSIRDLGWGLVLSLGARLVAVVATLPLALVDEDLVAPDTTAFDGFDRSIGLLVALSVVAVLLAPVLEELFFRGVVQRSLEAATGPVAAVAVASALFGLAHLGLDLGPANVGVVVATGSAGVVLG